MQFKDVVKLVVDDMKISDSTSEPDFKTCISGSP